MARAVQADEHMSKHTSADFLVVSSPEIMHTWTYEHLRGSVNQLKLEVALDSPIRRMFFVRLANMLCFMAMFWEELTRDSRLFYLLLDGNGEVRTWLEARPSPFLLRCRSYIALWSKAAGVDHGRLPMY